MKKRHLISAAILAGIMAACGQKQATTRQESNKDLERMENVSIHVTEDCIQVYENSNCRTTTATIDEVDYMVGYSDPLYFSRMFKHDEGVSPTAFRNLVLTKK